MSGSFGKDPALLARVGSFRQMGTMAASKPQRSGGGGGSSGQRFSNVYRPSMVTPDRVRLVESRYEVLRYMDKAVVRVPLPHWQYVQHFFAKNKKSAICSGGPMRHIRGQREDCLGCDEFWGGMQVNEKGKKSRGAMGMSDQFVFSVWHYANYHSTDATNKDGSVRVDPRTNQPYVEWQVCLGRGCDNCRLGRPVKDGHTLHWSMGFGHYNTLLASQDQIEKSCVTCGGRDTIVSRAWLCQGPNCGEAVIDLETTDLTDKDIREITIKEGKCPHCGFVNFLSEYYECQQCPKGKRATLFDVDLKVMCVKQGSGEEGGNILQISSYSDPHPVDPSIASKIVPYPLDKLFAPTPLDIQARVFGLPLPSPNTQQTQQQGQPVQRQPRSTEETAKPYGMFRS